MKARWLVFAVVVLVVGYAPTSCSRALPRIASKKFTESVILGEILQLKAKADGIESQHLEELGGTRLVYENLLEGQLDVYPEYTGTISHELLFQPDLNDLAVMRRKLESQGVKMSEPLGFSNSYALGMREEVAAEKNIRTISDLKRHPDLVLRFSNEFMERDDGWPGLAREYGLSHRNVRGMDHDLAYRELESHAADVTDVYTTDAKIKYYELRLLKDDRRYFPDYEAVFLYRDDLIQKSPGLVDAIKSLEGRITVDKMRSLNGRAEIMKETEQAVAAEFLQAEIGVRVQVEETSTIDELWARTVEHINLVRMSLVSAILVAIPLGVLAAKFPQFGHFILGGVGIIQTIPGLAMLVILIPPVSALGLNSVGQGSGTVLIALFLYSLLPIVRNTHSGLSNISPTLKESAEALGLSRWARLWRIELPMASPTILAGVKIAAVINVGFATLAALIGAGGYGQTILTAIRRNDTHKMIYEGALPAALLAIAVLGIFELTERRLTPKGLRLR